MNLHYLDDTDELFRVMQGHSCVYNAITAGKYSLDKVLFFLMYATNLIKFFFFFVI